MPLIMVGRAVTLTSESQAGGALPSNWVGIGASDGSLFQALLVESAANPNLRVTLYGATNKVGVNTIGGDGLTAGTIALTTIGNIFEFNGTSWDRIRHSFIQAVSGINSNGVGSTLDLVTTPMSRHTIEVDLTVGSSAYVIELQGLIGAGAWTVLGILSSSDAPDMLHIVNKPVTQLRYNITTIGSGNTMTINILSIAR